MIDLSSYTDVIGRLMIAVCTSGITLIALQSIYENAKTTNDSYGYKTARIAYFLFITLWWLFWFFWAAPDFARYVVHGRLLVTGVNTVALIASILLVIIIFLHYSPDNVLHSKILKAIKVLVLCFTWLGLAVLFACGAYIRFFS